MKKNSCTVLFFAINACELQDKTTLSELLSPDNQDHDELVEFARHVASESVQGQLPQLEYATNHHDEPDVAVFDFATLAIADYSCLAKRRCDFDLLQVIVGDSAIEVRSSIDALSQLRVLYRYSIYLCCLCSPSGPQDRAQEKAS